MHRLCRVGGMRPGSRASQFLIYTGPSASHHAWLLLPHGCLQPAFLTGCGHLPAFSRCYQGLAQHLAHTRCFLGEWREKTQGEREAGNCPVGGAAWKKTGEPGRPGSAPTHHLLGVQGRAHFFGVARLTIVIKLFFHRPISRKI